MPLVSLAPILTPHGRLTLVPDHEAVAVDAELAQRLQSAFARGSGHGLFQLGANEVGVALPGTLSFWREFAATYVTAVCTQLAPVSGRNLHVPVPADGELDQFVLSAPPMSGAEYLTAMASARASTGGQNSSSGFTNWTRMNSSPGQVRILLLQERDQFLGMFSAATTCPGSSAWISLKAVCRLPLCLPLPPGRAAVPRRPEGAGHPEGLAGVHEPGL
jgi:hypothetical protein